MTPLEVSTVLAGAGFAIPPGTVTVSAREDRWMARLPGDRLAWFPANDAGARHLVTEGRVLDLLAAHCTFASPRVLVRAPAGWQLRTVVPGLCEPWQLYERTRRDRALAWRIGHALGTVLADQHLAIRAEHTAGWLPRRPSWPQPDGILWRTLPHMVDDPALLRRMEQVIRRYEAEDAASTGRVLVHGDLGFHNIAIDPATDEVRGVFDYEDASWSDRHQDFRYLVFPDGLTDEAELDGALAAYEPAVGVRLDRFLIRLCNAACAIGFLAHRHGVPPDARSCGRTLAEDLAWVGHALDGLGAF